jgi:hypothetical protein
MAHSVTLDSEVTLTIVPAETKTATTLDVEEGTLNFSTGLGFVTLEGEPRSLSIYPDGGKPANVVAAEAEIANQMAIIVKQAAEDGQLKP